MTNKTTFLTTVILSSILLTSGLVGAMPSTYAHTDATNCTDANGTPVPDNSDYCFYGSNNPSQVGTTYTVTVTANGDLERTHDWTINKVVSQETFDLFQGDQGTATYTVSVEKDDGTDVGLASGDICVQNGGEYWTRNLAISVDVDNPADTTVLGSSSVDVSSAPTLAPGETHCYAYDVEFDASALPDTSYRVVSSVTIDNHSGNVGSLHEVNTKADFNIPSTPSIIHNDSIDVDDTNGDSWSTSASAEWTYDRTFSCADEGDNPNTATIAYSGESSDANVNVACYDLVVVKDAETSFQRDYDWTITKSSPTTEINMQVNQEAVTVDYSIDLTATPVDYDWNVGGIITISNPAPMAATLTGVQDVLSDGTPATVTCPSLEIPAGGELVCTYETDLTSGNDLTNTATATLQNTPSGTTDFSGNTDVTFGDPVDTQDACVTLNDTNIEGPQNVVVCHDTITPVNYSVDFGPYAEPIQTSHINTATIATDDGVEKYSTVEIPITVGAPDGEGCTLTIGYWKAHSNPEFNGFQHYGEYLEQMFDPQTYDLDGDGIADVSNASEAYEIFTSAQGNDQIAKVKAQLLAALLNEEADADTSDVDDVIADAQAFLSNYESLNKKELREQASALIDALSSYNEGITGPGHCTE